MTVNSFNKLINDIQTSLPMTSEKGGQEYAGPLPVNVYYVFFR